MVLSHSQQKACPRNVQGVMELHDLQSRIGYNNAEIMPPVVRQKSSFETDNQRSCLEVSCDWQNLYRKEKRKKTTLQLTNRKLISLKMAVAQLIRNYVSCMKTERLTSRLQDIATAFRGF